MAKRKNSATSLRFGPSFGVETGARWSTGLALMAMSPAFYRNRFALRDSDNMIVATLKEDWLTFWLVVRVALATHDPETGGRKSFDGKGELDPSTL